MPFLSKYNTGRHIYVPMVKRGVVDHAVGADWTPSAGDVKISKDGGAAANVTNLPTAIAMGNSALWDFSLTATELSCAQAVITIADSATKAVEDSAFVVETYGNASAQHAFDLGTATQGVNVTQFGGSNGTFASGRPEVNTSHLAGSAVDQSGGLINANVKQISTDATAADNLEAMLDGTGGVTLTTAITGDVTGSLSGSVGSVTGNVGGNVTGSVGSLAAQAKTDVNGEVVDALNVDTYAEPGQEAPPATTTLVKKIGYLYKMFRNKKTQTSTTFSLFADDASTVDQKATVSDDATTATRGEIASGP